MVGVKGGQERAIAVICLLLLTTKIDSCRRALAKLPRFL
jgi:hypothetical protein